MIKQSIHQENITVINIYAPNIRAPNYIKQILTDLKEEIDNLIIGDFSIPLSAMDRSFRHKINRKTLDLSHVLYRWT